MKRLLLIFTAFILSYVTHAQHAVQIKNLWEAPRVHVVFEGYTISFTIKDVRRALQLLAETGDSTYGNGSFLDTAKDYYVELYPGYNTRYNNRLQPMLQKGIGTFLLTAGHAVIETPKHKKVKGLTVDMAPYVDGESITDAKFYDAKSGDLIFNGLMSADMANKDLGIE